MFPLVKSDEQSIVNTGIDFRERLQENETILSFSVSDGGSGIASNAKVDGTQVLATISGGEIGQSYIVTFSMVGSEGTIDSGKIVVYVTPNAGLCIISINLKNLGLAPIEGATILASVKSTQPWHGSILSGQPIKTITDSHGNAEITVPQGVRVSILLPTPSHGRIEVDTTGHSEIELSEAITGQY